jgi:hypothetical protein
LIYWFRSALAVVPRWNEKTVVATWREAIRLVGDRYRRAQGQTDARGRQNPHPVERRKTFRLLNHLVSNGADSFPFFSLVLFSLPSFLGKGLGGWFSFLPSLSF